MTIYQRLLQLYETRSEDMITEVVLSSDSGENIEIYPSGLLIYNNINEPLIQSNEEGEIIS